MYRLILSFAGLLGLWLLLSGIYTPMVVGLGVLSVLVVVFVTRRMDAVDGDRVNVSLKPLATVNYMIWLFGEIAKANWAVTKVILSPRMLINQHLFSVRCSQTSDLGQVVFANSITLTPGTISVETETDRFLVHAVAYEPGAIDALADMDRRISAIEQVGAS
jgi:multicomponent Na+:H+ antiporter subunit E